MRPPRGRGGGGFRGGRDGGRGGGRFGGGRFGGGRGHPRDEGPPAEVVGQFFPLRLLYLSLPASYTRMPFKLPCFSLHLFNCAFCT
jgi:hypothetical protein